MSGAIPPSPNTPSWGDAQLKHRDNFIFSFYVSLNLCDFKKNSLSLLVVKKDCSYFTTKLFGQSYTKNYFTVTYFPKILRLEMYRNIILYTVLMRL